VPYKDPVVRKKKSAERWRSWAKRNPKKAKEHIQRWQRDNVEYFLYYAARRRAKRDGVPFEITRNDIPPIPDICPVLGIPLFRKKGRGPCENSPTLDKIDNSKGYTKDNIAIVSFRANRLKADMTLEELDAIRRYISRRDLVTDRR
jgi:hypothetical protein